MIIKLVTNLTKNKGKWILCLEKMLKVFKQTAQYDKIIYNWLNEK